MQDDNKNKNVSPKKGFPGSFILFLVAAVLIVFLVQNFSNQKSAKVAFSHQVEHLVNLNLIQPEESRKTSLNDNLVNFSGKFRSTLPEDSKTRYRFLELLNQNHELKNQQNSLAEQLTTQKTKVIDSADWFINLSGISIPESGYNVIGGVYDTPDRENRIIIKKVTDRNVVSLKTLTNHLAAINSHPTNEKVSQLGADLSSLIQNFRSPLLGIGSESMKQQLKNMSQEVAKTQSSNQSAIAKLAVYENVMHEMQNMVSQLNRYDNNMRLVQLRSVRSYREDIDQYNVVSSEVDENQMQLDKAQHSVANVIWFFNNKELSTKALMKQDPEVYSHWFANAQKEWNNFPANKGASFKAPDQPRTTVLERTFKSEENSPNYFGYLFSFLPVILIVLLLYFIFSRQMKGGVGASGAMNFGKSPAKLWNRSTNRVTFKDVAGVEEALEELEEIVEFLKSPSKFTALGGRIPKGVLCVGPPGTGKTLIARAIAGEADRPFFSISGSDFVEMFVGVGASRIRDLFDQAKKHAPCIVFIDEIDAVGRHRGAGIGGGHDEREQTLNQLLVEMDGFDANEGVILIAATNRPDVLDKALLRPGRFDRRIVIDLPDLKGRFEILKVHARKIKLDPSVDLMAIARGTAGASGADLANLLNEAALIAARKGRSAITTQDTMEASDKVRFGKERRSLEITEDEKKTTAYHESGHTIVALMVEHADPVEKVTIIPRGFALGATYFLPEKNRLNWWKKELHDQLAVLMGGRVAEEIFVGDISSGAQNDIERATTIARNMVCEWGMTDSLGTVAYDEHSSQNPWMGAGPSEKKYSEATAQIIDGEVRKLIDEAYKLATDIVNNNKEKVQLMTDMLIEFETLDLDDIKKIVDGSWDIEEKRKRLKAQETAHRNSESTPPPPPKPISDKLAIEGGSE